MLQKIVETLVETLFPLHDIRPRPRPYGQIGQSGVALVKNDELIAIANWLKLNKAPDGIPTEAIKTVIDLDPY